MEPFVNIGCNQPCGPTVGRSPNTYSMVHKNWEKNDDEIEFVGMQTIYTIFSRAPASKKSEGIRNWYICRNVWQIKCDEFSSFLIMFV